MMRSRACLQFVAALACAGHLCAETPPLTELPAPAEPRLLLRVEELPAGGDKGKEKGKSEAPAGKPPAASAIATPSAPDPAPLPSVPATTNGIPGTTATSPDEGRDGPAAGSASRTLVPSVPYSTKIPSSTSTTKQFAVYGADLDVRAAFCMLCDETSASLGKVLKDNGQFVLPVIVMLKVPPEITATGPAVTLNIDEFAHGGFRLQINAQLRTGFRIEEFKHQLVRVLLVERILRNHRKLNTNRQRDVLPAWVMTGVDQALEYRSRSRPSALFEAVFKRGQVYSLDKILSADPAQLDALSRGIYETSTCALVLTLLDQPDGPVRFARFLNALAVESKPDRALLSELFPNLATSKSALEKWWSLQMATMATPTALETLSAKQTEEQLDEALTLAVPEQRKSSSSHRVAKKEAPELAPTPAPAQEGEVSAEEKKPRGFLGIFKRNSKDEPKEGGEKSDTTKEGNPKGKSAAATMTIPVVDFAGPFEGMLALAELLQGGNWRGGGREVILGFGKKKEKTEEGSGGEQGKAEPTPKESKTAESIPEAKEESKSANAKPKAADVKAERAEDSLQSLPKKGGESRSIGARPEELGKSPPVVAEGPAKKTAEAPDVEEEKKPERPRRHWFGRKPDADEESAKVTKVGEEPAKKETPLKSDTPAKPVAKAEPKPQPKPALVSKPEPKPEPKPEVKFPREEELVLPPVPEKVAAFQSRSSDGGSSHSATVTRVMKPGMIPLEDFVMIAKRSDRDQILNRCAARLTALKVRAHPLYRPLIDEYIDVVQGLVNGKTKGVTEKLEQLRSERESVHTVAIAVETHLDTYEANHTGTVSRSFDDFLKLDQQLEKERLPRGDALSKYLDAVENEYR